MHTNNSQVKIFITFEMAFLQRNSYSHVNREYLFPFLWFENWSLKSEFSKGSFQIENIFGEGENLAKKILLCRRTCQARKIHFIHLIYIPSSLQETKRKIITDLQHSTGKISFGRSRRLLFQNLISLQHAYNQIYDINILNRFWIINVLVAGKKLPRWHPFPM